MQGLWRLHQVRSILKPWKDIHHCVKVEAQVRVVIVVCCTSGARPSSIACPGTIARFDTKVMARWCCAVHILRNMLPASIAGRNPMELMLNFLKVEHKYTIKWSFSFFFWWPSVLHTSKAVRKMLLLAGSSTGMANMFPIAYRRYGSDKPSSPYKMYIDLNHRDSWIWVPLVCNSHHVVT
jgi:hypothetical protein